MSTEVSEEQASHSAHSLYSKLLEAFPTYTTDFESKWQSWQQAISPSSGFVSPYQLSCCISVT